MEVPSNTITFRSKHKRLRKIITGFMILFVCNLTVAQNNSDDPLLLEIENYSPTPERRTPYQSNNSIVKNKKKGNEKSVLPSTFTTGFSENLFTSVLEDNSCFDITSITVNSVNANVQVGTFSDGIAGAGLEIDEGIILTTGTVTEAFTSNSSNGTSQGTNNATLINDSDLDGIALNGQGTFDEAILLIDFAITADIDGFRLPFQFASEDYNESVCSNFDDVFSVFITGPGITGFSPISFIPGTSNPVSINSVNNGSCGASGNGTTADLTQSQYFIDNTITPNPVFCEFDGVIKTLYAKQSGLSAGTYQIKLVIADVGDDNYDCGVFVGGMEPMNGGVPLACDCVNNPLADPNGDCDSDGILNQNESSGEAALDPCDPNPLAVASGDCDGDGILNSNELNSFEALDACQPDPLGLRIGDCDQDGLMNTLEADAVEAVDPCLPDPTAIPLGDCDGDGVLNGEDQCPLTYGDDGQGCPDNDGDDINDLIDIDDDNDGVLDEDEQVCFGVVDLTSLTFSGNAVANLTPSSITNSNARYRTSYSDQVFEAPIHLEFSLANSSEMMIGFLPLGGNETGTGWNDGAYKWYETNGRLYGKFLNTWNPFNININSTSIVGIDVDENGVLEASVNGNVLHTVNTGVTFFNLAVTSGLPSELISNVVFEATDKNNCSDLDTDSDGTPNHFDLDSDGDGCSDAFEAGATNDLTQNFTFSSADSNNDGLADEVDSDLNGEPNYTSTYSTLALDELEGDCCDLSGGITDCDGDGFTNAEEIAGICGFTSDPYDYNSPFKHQETLASGTTDDLNFQLVTVNVAGAFDASDIVHLTVKSGHNLVANTDFRIRNLIIEPGASFDLNGRTVQIHGDLTVNGDFIHNLGHVEMNNNCEARHIYGASNITLHNLTIENNLGVTLETPLNVSGVISPNLGLFDLNENELVLTSFPINSIIQTGSIGEIQSGADVIGDIKIQRYVESLEEGYRLLGPPIKNLRISDLADDFVTTGFTGSDYPGHYFTNIKYYEETNRSSGSANSGYKDILNITDPLLDYQGYYAYFPESTSNTILEVQGEFHKGELIYNLTHTSSGVPAEDGWHCLINPYPSAIDLESSCISFNNVGGAVYILDHGLGADRKGLYAVYNNGISVNGGTNIIASFQSFLVQATGPNAFLKFNECAKTDEQGIFYRSGEEDKSLIRLALQRDDQLQYETVIAFDENATDQFDPSMDARRWETDLHSIATVMNEDLMTINTLPNLHADLSIPIAISIPEAGEYQLAVSEILNLSSNNCLFIEDVLTGELTEVHENSMISFTVAEEVYDEVRFKLHSNRTAEVNVTEPKCFGSEDGSVAVHLYSSQEASFKWSDESNALIHENQGPISELNNIPSGNYSVQIVNPEAICPSVVMNIKVAQVEEERVELNSTPDYCSGGFAELKVLVQGAENLTVNLFKDYELISTKSSSEVVEINNIEGDLYDVQVVTGCSVSEYVVDLSDEDAVRAKFEAPNEMIIENIGVELEVESLSENADYHQWFVDEYLKGEEDVISLTFDEIGSYTLKLNSANEFCDDIYQQEIMISAANTIKDNLEKDFLTVNSTNEISIIRLNDSSGKIDVTLYDIKGSKIVEYVATTKNRISIDKQFLSAGVYILEIRTETGQVMSSKYSK